MGRAGRLACDVIKEGHAALHCSIEKVVARKIGPLEPIALSAPELIALGSLVSCKGFVRHAILGKIPGFWS